MNRPRAGPFMLFDHEGDRTTKKAHSTIIDTERSSKDISLPSSSETRSHDANERAEGVEHTSWEQECSGHGSSRGLASRHGLAVVVVPLVGIAIVVLTIVVDVQPVAAKVNVDGKSFVGLGTGVADAAPGAGTGGGACCGRIATGAGGRLGDVGSASWLGIPGANLAPSRDAEAPLVPSADVRCGKGGRASAGGLTVGCVSTSLLRDGPLTSAAMPFSTVHSTTRRGPLGALSSEPSPSEPSPWARSAAAKLGRRRRRPPR